MSWQVKRNRILFWGGLGGITISFALWAILGRTPDPQLMATCAAMIGLTAALKQDEEHKS